MNLHKSVLFVPHTPRSELEDRRILCKKNPFTGLPCAWEKCLSCRDEKTAGKCRKRNITYMMTCDSCYRKEGKEEVTDTGVAEDQETAAYVGETYRSSYERGKEHLAS